MSEFKNVSILLGVVTETESLRQTVKTILRICDHKDLREIIIDYPQHAAPESIRVIHELAKQEDDVPIVTFMQKRKGVSGIIDMIDAARGSHCILAASDLALDLECIPIMIEKAKKNPNRIISSSRWLKGCKFYGYAPLKKAVNYLGQFFLRFLFHVKLTDLTNPYQIVPTKIYQSIHFECEDFPVMIEMVLKPLRLGCQFEEIPTNCYGRTQGKSSNSFLQTARFLPVALHIRFTKKEKLLTDPGSFSLLKDQMQK